MLTEKQLARLTLLMMNEDFEKSPAAQETQYQEMAEEYNRLCAQLYDKLDDRRGETLRELLRLRDQLEYEHNLHYLMRGVLRGVELGGRIEIPGEKLTLS